MLTIRNEHLERRIKAEQAQRGKATMASTAEELLIERLMQVEPIPEVRDRASVARTSSRKATPAN